MNTFLYLIWAGVLWLGGMEMAGAIPPPDFLFSVGAQIGQVFSVIAIFLSAIVAASWQFLRTYFHIIKGRRWVWVLLAVLVLALSFGGAVVYQKYTQEQALKEWVQEADVQPLKHREALAGEDFVITNEDFAAVLASKPFVLDAREDEEYGIGHLDGSVHIRYGDLFFSGKWGELPVDEPVYVLCWSGIRGSEVAEFLRTKGVDARYLEGGADGWVSWGGEWTGEIKFSKVYSAKNYQRIVTLKEVQADDVALVDSRPEEKYLEWHIPGSVNIATFYTASAELEKKLAEVEEGSKIITICDDWVSCFDAKITGIKLEGLGHEFVGRYNNPLAAKNAWK